MNFCWKFELMQISRRLLLKYLVHHLSKISEDGMVNKKDKDFEFTPFESYYDDPNADGENLFGFFIENASIIIFPELPSENLGIMESASNAVFAEFTHESNQVEKIDYEQMNHSPLNENKEMIRTAEIKGDKENTVRKKREEFKGSENLNNHSMICIPLTNSFDFFWMIM